MLNGSRQKLSTLPETLEPFTDNVPVEQVSSVKSLGISIDENLTWQTHIDKRCKNIASGIGAMKRILNPLFHDLHFSAYTMLTLTTAI